MLRTQYGAGAITENGVATVCVDTHIQGASLSLHPSVFEIYQISKLRMKAGTPSCWLWISHDDLWLHEGVASGPIPPIIHRKDIHYSPILQIFPSLFNLFMLNSI